MRNPEGPPIKVADLSTAIPAGTGNFMAFSALALDPTDASNVAIVGSGATVKGVYASIGGGALARIADTTMSIPGSTSTFADFQSVSIDPGDLAFLATGSGGEKGIFADIGGTLLEVIRVNDSLGGLPITDLDFGPFGFSEAGGIPKVTYRAKFSDGTSGVFTAAVSLPSVPGDYNGNGIVDAADYTVWRDHLDQTFALQNRDSANTGPIGIADYTFWKSQYGNHTGSGAGSAASVPEPATLWILLPGILTMCGWRRPKVS